MYAIIETGGKQIKVNKGDTVFVEKLDVNVGDEYTFDKVLFVGGAKAKVGKPYVKDATVTAKVVKQGLGRKIKVFTYKAKTNSKRTRGHRQPFTSLEIVAING